MKKIYITLTVILLLTQSAYSQIPQLQIKSKPKQIQEEFVGSRHKDPNGRICAAIKVISNLDGLQFDAYNGVVKVDKQRGGLDLVYLQPDERVLEIFHSGFKPLKIYLSEIGISLKSKQIWQVEIFGKIDVDELPITIKTQPDSITLQIDGNLLGMVEDKSYLVNKGSHIIRLTKPGFISVSEIITVDENHQLFNFTLFPSNACAEAEKEADEKFGGVFNFMMGYFYGDYSLFGIAKIFKKENPDPSIFLGKDPEYIKEYTYCYREESRSKKIKNFLTCCAMQGGCILILVSTSP